MADMVRFVPRTVKRFVPQFMVQALSMKLGSQNERLKAAREQAGFASMRDATNRFSWPYETYKKHESTRAIDEAMALKYGRAYGVDPGWLLWGINPPAWDAEGTTLSSEHQFRCVPKLTPEQAVHMPQQFSKSAKLSDQTVLDDSSDIGPRAFSIELDDDSMLAKPPDAESFKPGDVLVIDPDRQPAPGDFVIAHVEGEARAIFRKYRPRGKLEGSNLYELAPLNGDYPTEQIGPGRQQGRVIGVMIRHIRKYGQRG